MQPMPYRLSQILLLAAVFFFSLLSGCQPEPPASVDQWRAGIITAHGGPGPLARITTLLYNGTITTRNDQGPVVLALSRPRRLRVAMRYSNGFEDRLLLGKRGWRNFGSGFEETAGPSLDAMIFQYNHLDLPMGLVDEKYKISYTVRNIDGRDHPALELSGAEGPPMTVVIDPDTGLIQRVDGRISAGDREVVMGVGYFDYREVAGVMLPHRIVNYVNGNAIAESRYNKVIVNTQLAEDYFKNPNPDFRK